MGGLCAGTVKTLRLCGRTQGVAGTLGSHCGRLHTLKTPWLPGGDIAGESELTLRTVQILWVVLVTEQTNIIPTGARAQTMTAFNYTQLCGITSLLN